MMKIKQKHIADILGISQPLMSMILRGERNITYGLAKKLNALTKIEITFWMEAQPDEIKRALSHLEE
jgi:transcriptional regulator with XRE-family HTH domain